MVMVMSNCSLAMNSTYGYSFNDCARVMEVHFASMFMPGFFTGKLMELYGSFIVALIGSVIFGLASIIFLLGTDLWNFYVGMSLLGVGWNFAFSAGTVMLTGSYRKNEATDVQAVNDFILFTVAGIGSLLSGVIFSYDGWYVLIYVVTGMMIFDVILYAASWRIKAEIEESVRDADNEEWTVTGNSTVPPLSAGSAVPIRSISGDKRQRSASRGSNSGNGTGRSKSFADMFVPDPVIDEHGTMRINSISVA